MTRALSEMLPDGGILTGIGVSSLVNDLTDGLYDKILTQESAANVADVVITFLCVSIDSSMTLENLPVQISSILTDNAEVAMVKHRVRELLLEALENISLSGQNTGTDALTSTPPTTTLDHIGRPAFFSHWLLLIFGFFIIDATFVHIRLVKHTTATASVVSFKLLNMVVLRSMDVGAYHLEWLLIQNVMARGGLYWEVPK